MYFCVCPPNFSHGEFEFFIAHTVLPRWKTQARYKEMIESWRWNETWKERITELLKWRAGTVKKHSVLPNKTVVENVVHYITVVFFNLYLFCWKIRPTHTLQLSYHYHEVWNLRATDLFCGPWIKIRDCCVILFIFIIPFIPVSEYFISDKNICRPKAESLIFHIRTIYDIYLQYAKEESTNS